MLQSESGESVSERLIVIGNCTIIGQGKNCRTRGLKLM